MNKTIRMIASALALALGWSWVAEADVEWKTSGSISIGKSAQYTMPADEEIYLSLKGMKAGGEYTIVASGLGATASVVYTYSEDGELWDSYLASSEPDVKTADQERCFVTSDDWYSSYILIEDPDDKEYQVKPKGYFLYISGYEGETITVTASSGYIEEPIPEGSIEKPKTITPTTTPTTVSAKFVEDGAYWFSMSANPGTYLLTASKGTEATPVNIAISESTAVTSMKDVRETVADDYNAAYLLTVGSSGEISFCVTGEGEEFALTHQYAEEGTLGRLTVNIKGTADGTWSIKGAKGAYEGGYSLGILGQQTVVFNSVNGYSTPGNQVVTPTEENPEVEITGTYNDKFDPKDDTVGGATKLTPSAKEASAGRTLFIGDEADHFSFTAKDGVYYNFELDELEGDAQLVIFAKGDESEVLAGPATKVAAFAPGKGDYIVKVAHSGEEEVDSKYVLDYSSANVGAISFAKTAVAVKKTAGTVTLSVNRSSAEGKVRVKWGTVNDTAQPGEDYVADNGELTWENGDKKAKTITIKLIPEVFAEEAVSRRFSVQLEPLSEEEIGEGEYIAAITAGKEESVITVTETKGKGEKEIKVATTKTEDVDLEIGTYQGVIVEDGTALTNGFPALASVTFSAKNAAKKALSAKVTLGGKSYTFAADAWSEESTDTEAIAEMTCVTKVGKTSYENTMRVTVVRGATAEEGDWAKAEAKVELTMNVPDAKGSGVQEDIVYGGTLYRDNAKIQGYLDAVVEAAGYYTVALVPTGITSADGVPAGNGYLTLTIDNKGKAKIAGMLADGSTKPSYSSIVAVKTDSEGKTVVLVPVFVAKSPYCFGGTLRLMADDEGKFIVDSSVTLVWNNDNAALTYDGEAGWSIDVEPVGGYFNTVNNLQAYYKTCEFSVAVTEPEGFLEEALASGYNYVTENTPSEANVTVLGNTISTDKKVLVKDGKLVDFANSVNPCNVQVKLARATGIVSGSFSVWSESEDGTAQKELAGLKHYGILILSRDGEASLDPEVMTAGFFTQTATIKYEDPVTFKTKTRKYTASNPFNILAIDQGEIDWYAKDWGERP